MMLELNVTLIGAIIGVLVGLTTLVAVIRRNFAAGTRENTEAIAAFSTRLQKVENELSHLPTSKEFQKLSESVVEIRSDLNAINKSVEATERSCERMEKFLMQKGAS